MVDEAHELFDGGQAADTTLELPFDLRQKSRQRARLEDGGELALFLPRGTVLRDGMKLRTKAGRVVAVRAAIESVSTVSSDDALLLTRVAYHLGNRHVPLQIEATRVRYQHDHVLDDMVRGLGGRVVAEQASFEPEAGAYGHGHGSHGHAPGDHAHGSHGHEH